MPIYTDLTVLTGDMISYVRSTGRRDIRTAHSPTHRLYGFIAVHDNNAFWQIPFDLVQAQHPAVFKLFSTPEGSSAFITGIVERALNAFPPGEPGIISQLPITVNACGSQDLPSKTRTDTDRLLADDLLK